MALSYMTGKEELWTAREDGRRVEKLVDNSII